MKLEEPSSGHIYCSYGYSLTNAIIAVRVRESSEFPRTLGWEMGSFSHERPAFERRIIAPRELFRV